MAIAITAKNTETIIIPCYRVLSMDMDFLGSQNCPKSSKAFKTSPRRPKTVPGASSWSKTAQDVVNTAPWQSEEILRAFKDGHKTTPEVLCATL